MNEREIRLPRGARPVGAALAPQGLARSNFITGGLLRHVPGPGVGSRMSGQAPAPRNTLSHSPLPPEAAPACLLESSSSVSCRSHRATLTNACRFCVADASMSRKFSHHFFRAMTGVPVLLSHRLLLHPFRPPVGITHRPGPASHPSRKTTWAASG